MPIDSPEGAAFAAAMKAAMASPLRDVEVVGPDGMPMRIHKEPEPGVKARIEVAVGDAGSLVTTVWEPSPVRPAAYPNTLPFIPNVGAGTSAIGSEGRRRAQVQWFGISDVEGALQQLVAESVAEGWTRTPLTLRTPGPTRVLTFERGSEARTITAVSVRGFGMLSLSDVGPRPPDEAA